MQAVIQRAVTAAQFRRTRGSDLGESETITLRLTEEFPALARDEIERCVTDTWICVQHLGLVVTETLVEQVAREHLLGMVNSVPPSGRRSPAYRRDL